VESQICSSEHWINVFWVGVISNDRLISTVLQINYSEISSDDLMISIKQFIQPFLRIHCHLVYKILNFFVVTISNVMSLSRKSFIICN